MDTGVSHIYSAELRFSADNERRVCFIQLDAKVFRPHERARDFKHPQLLAWIVKSRSELLAAIFTLARAWYAAGSPEPRKVRPLGGFEEWMRVIGGILELAGIKGFMQNASVLRQRSSDENEEYIDLLEHLEAYFQQKTFTTSDVVQNDKDIFGDDVAEFAMRQDARTLGKTFSKLKGRPLREDGLRIEQLEEKKHNLSCWRIVRDSGAVQANQGRPG